MRKKQKAVPRRSIDRLVNSLPTQIFRHYGEQVGELLTAVRFVFKAGEPDTCIVGLEDSDDIWKYSDTAKLGWVKTA